MKLSKRQWRIVYVINAMCVGGSIALAVHVHWIFIVPLCLNLLGVKELMFNGGESL